MALPGVNIQKQRGGLNRKALSDDMISGLVVSGVAASGFALNTVKPLLSLKDAEALGIDADYDTTNNILVHYHIDEFFRLNPSGKLYLMIVAQTVTLAQMALVGNDYAKKVINEANGTIRQIGLVRNPASGYMPVYVNGLDEDVLEAVVRAQQLYDQIFSEYRPAHFLVEGRSLNGTAAAAANLRNLENGEAGQVTVVIGQDPEIAAKNAAWANHAAVGTALGVISSAKVNEDPGYVEKFNLTSAADKRWLDANLSSGQNIKNYDTAAQNALHDKGYMFVRKFSDYPGSYFNAGPTCIAATDDYAWIPENRTVDKAVRLVYKALLPKVNSPQRVDQTEGTLDPEVVSYFETLGKSALEQMERDGEISGKDVYVDPDQNLLTASELIVEFELFPTGTARKITGKIGFKNPFKA